MPTKKKRPTTVDSQQYDIPRDRHERRLYDIPRNGSTFEASLDYSAVRPLSQSISTVQSTECIIPRSPSSSTQLQQEGGSEQNGHIGTNNEQEYIYMDDCTEGKDTTNKASRNVSSTEIPAHDTLTQNYSTCDIIFVKGAWSLQSVH